MGDLLFAAGEYDRLLALAAAGWHVPERVFGVKGHPAGTIIFAFSPILLPNLFFNWTFAKLSPLPLGEESGVRAWGKHINKARHF
jgi:hypothetical protein